MSGEFQRIVDRDVVNPDDTNPNEWIDTLLGLAPIGVSISFTVSGFAGHKGPVPASYYLGAAILGVCGVVMHEILIWTGRGATITEQQQRIITQLQWVAEMLIASALGLTGFWAVKAKKGR